MQIHRRLFSLTEHSRLPFLCAAACGVLAGYCSLIQACTLSVIVDEVFLARHGLGLVKPWLLLLLLVILVRGSFLGIHEIASKETAIRIKHKVREKLMARIYTLGPAFLWRQSTGELTSTVVQGVEALEAYFAKYLPQLAVGTLVPMTILLVVFPLDPLSGAILLLTGPLIPFFMYMIGRTAQSASQRQYATLGRLSSHLLDSLQGLTTLKVFGQSKAQVGNIAQVADQFRAVTLKVLQVSFLSAFALELIATISTAMIAVEVALRLLYGHMEFREALFLLLLAPEFYAPLRALGARFHASMGGTSAARRIFQLLDAEGATPRENGDEVRRAQAEHQRAEAPTAIRLSGVSYSYPGSTRPAISQVDLDVRRGERIAIVGPSGAGKSTLAALMLGFISPTQGSLQVLGRSSGQIPQDERARLIGWVPQAPHLFHATIRENLTLWRADVTDFQIQRSVQMAHLEEFIDSLPNGLGCHLGEGGARLSSGEAQRLALARALLSDAPILLLDEPTSRLDAETEAALDGTLRSLRPSSTVIIIAHRLSTARKAERIFVFQEGQLVEQGNPSELAAGNGFYAQLVSTASEEGIWSAERDDRPDSKLGMEPISRLALPGSGPAHAPPSEERKPEDQGALKLLLSFAKGSWCRIIWSAFLSSLTIGSSVALLGTSAWLISAAALQPSIASLAVAIVGVRFFGISRAVFRYFERLASHSTTFGLLRNIRVWFYSALEPLAPARIMSYRSGDLVARAVADVEVLENLYARVLAPPLTAVLVSGVIATYLAWIRVPMVAAAYGCLFAVVAVGVPATMRLLSQRPGPREVQYRALLAAHLVDSIQGMPDLMAFGRATEQAGMLGKMGIELESAQRKMGLLAGLQDTLFNVLSNLSVLLVLVYAIPAVMSGQIQGLALGSLVLITLASFEAASGLPLAGQLWPATQAAAARLCEVVTDRPTMIIESDGSGRCAESPSVGSGHAIDREIALRVHSVGFTYPGRATPALSAVSFDLRAGNRIAIVGPSGAGKSTVANLLLRFWDFDSGAIWFAGASIRNQDPEDVRSRIGYLSQQPYIFDSTVFENLRLARRGANRADVERAARRAQIHERIAALPQGYDTPLGEHGVRISAGERQRLGLARLFLRGAPFLLLDEPTANLDVLTEAAIFALLHQFMDGRTSLLITHRLVAMERLDHILVMNRGEIVESGTHDQLLMTHGLYERLWTLQHNA